MCYLRTWWLISGVTALKFPLLNRWDGFWDVSVTQLSEIYVGFLCKQLHLEFFPAGGQNAFFFFAYLHVCMRFGERWSWSVLVRISKNIRKCTNIPPGSKSSQLSFNRQMKTLIDKEFSSNFTTEPMDLAHKLFSLPVILDYFLELISFNTSSQPPCLPLARLVDGMLECAYCLPFWNLVRLAGIWSLTCFDWLFLHILFLTFPLWTRVINLL